jgi:Kef-type K+ transport system membrane component KefB/nucleotide-binding universal stress UspA family protein
LHQDTLYILLQLFLLLISARILGELFQKIKQPPVVGEILAGIILGPSLLANLSFLKPLFNIYIYPSASLEIISLIGALLLLFITGFEIDLGLIKHHSKSATATAFGGLIVPFISGLLISYVIPDKYLVYSSDRLMFSLFIATAMSVSAIPVIAKVLIDLNLLRRDIGQITIAAGMIDDTIAWIILTVIIGLIQLGVLTLSLAVFAIVKVLLFVFISFYAGRWLVKISVQFLQDKFSGRYKIISLIFAYIFLFSFIAQAIQLEAVFGAFLIGIVFSQIPTLPKIAISRIESITFGVFAPIFFASAGLKVDIKALFNFELAFIALVLILVATISKVFGSYLGARFIAKIDNWTALSFGAGLNARGAIQIIIATIGLSFNIISPEIFSIIVLMAVTTSLMAPIMLKFTLKKVIPKDSELERLKKEELTKNLISNSINRILMPVRYRGDYEKKMIESKIIQHLSKNKNLDITLLTVTNENEKALASSFLNKLEELLNKSNISKRIVISDSPLEAILNEAKKSYDLIIVGATEKSSENKKIFNPLVDDLIRMSPCKSLVIQSKTYTENWKLNKILVPSNSSLASKRAVELAFTLANPNDSEVNIISIIEDRNDEFNLDLEGNIKQRQKELLLQNLNELKFIGQTLGLKVNILIEVSSDVENEILKKAKDLNADLVILGTDIRPAGDSLYIGPRVEKILNNCYCPVAVFNSQ